MSPTVAHACPSVDKEAPRFGAGSCLSCGEVEYGSRRTGSRGRGDAARVASCIRRMGVASDLRESGELNSLRRSFRPSFGGARRLRRRSVEAGFAKGKDYFPRPRRAGGGSKRHGIPGNGLA